MLPTRRERITRLLDRLVDLMEQRTFGTPRYTSLANRYDRLVKLYI